MWTFRSRSLALLAIAAASTAAAAGCGSDNNSSSSSTPAATAAAAGTTAASTTAASTPSNDVAKYLQRPTDIGITEPVKGGIPKGKNIVFIQCGFPDCATIGDILEGATKLVGWKLTRLPTQFTPESIKASWGEAVRRNPDAIVTTGSFEKSIYKTELAEAQKKKIPLIGFAEAEEGAPWLVSIINSESYVTSPDVSMVANGAKYVASKLPDGGKVLVVNHPGIVIIEQEAKTFKEYLATDCPKCEPVQVDIPATSIGKDAASKLATYLQTHSDIKYIFLTTPDVSIGLDAALKGAGVEPVPIITGNTNPASLERLQKGEAGLAAAIPTPFGGEAEWRAVDALARNWAGQSVDVDRDATEPFWIIEAGKVPPDRPLPMVADYQAKFKALWGIS